MNTSKSKFNLSKWYFDCVNNRGETIILYAAKLQFNKISVPYNSIIYRIGKNGFIHKSRFRNLSFPEILKNEIRLNDPKYGIVGSWKSSVPEIKERIFESEKGTLDWNCLQARSQSKVNIDSTNKIEGLGYAEHLTLTVEPWHIPMSQLRWGRYVTEGDYLVWIEMKSNPTKQWLLV